MVVSGQRVPGAQGSPPCAQILRGVLREAADVCARKGNAGHALAHAQTTALDRGHMKRALSHASIRFAVMQCNIYCPTPGIDVLCSKHSRAQDPCMRSCVLLGPIAGQNDPTQAYLVENGGDGPLHVSFRRQDVARPAGCIGPTAQPGGPACSHPCSALLCGGARDNGKKGGVRRGSSSAEIMPTLPLLPGQAMQSMKYFGKHLGSCAGVAKGKYA